MNEKIKLSVEIEDNEINLVLRALNPLGGWDKAKVTLTTEQTLELAESLHNAAYDVDPISSALHDLDKRVDNA